MYVKQSTMRYFVSNSIEDGNKNLTTIFNADPDPSFHFMLIRMRLFILMRFQIRIRVLLYIKVMRIYRPTRAPLWASTVLHGPILSLLSSCRGSRAPPAPGQVEVPNSQRISCLDSSLGRVSACDAGALGSIPGGSQGALLEGDYPGQVSLYSCILNVMPRWHT